MRTWRTNEPAPRAMHARVARRRGLTVLLGCAFVALLGTSEALAAPDGKPGAVPAAAVPPGSGPATGPGRRGGFPSEAMRRELLSRLASERAWRLVDGLKLDQAASARIFPVLSKYDELFFKLFGERRELNQQLRAEMAMPTPNDARLTSLVDKLVALRARRHTLESDRLVELRKLLTPWQQAMLVTLLPQVEIGFLNRIRHARDRDRDGREHDGPDRDGHEGEGGPDRHREGGPQGGFGADELY